MNTFVPIETPVSGEKARLCDRLLSGAAGPVFVLGRNKYAERIASYVAVEGFIDDFTLEASYLGRPVIRMKDLPRQAFVVSSVVEGRPLTALKRLQATGVRAAVDYFTLTRVAPDQFAPVDFCSHNREDILGNAGRYSAIYERLADETSRQIFAQVVQFRLTMDLKYMEGLIPAIDRQYFEDFLRLTSGEVFVDGGAYDGTTTAQFAANNPNYTRIYCFEPCPAVMRTARLNLAPLHHIEFREMGLGSTRARLGFNDRAGSASRLSPEGPTEIEVVTLDEEIKELVSFIKLDVEGSERAALIGAECHIREETPKLAVCVYHNQRDFWEIPETVLGFNERYQLYFRHYSEGVFETVMFFVPTLCHQ